MKFRITLIAATCCLLVSAAGAEMFVRSFNGVDPNGSRELCLNDVYINTADAEWLSSLFYCELEEGRFYQEPTYAVVGINWLCVPGANNYDTWLAPNVSLFADGNELATLFSGDLANAAASITFLCDLVEGEIPSWEGIAARFAFTADTSGVWALKVSKRGSEPVIHTGVITDGQMIWPEPIPGDLNADGSVNTADLDIVRANWAGDGIILGGLDYGDPSTDGEVGEDDLEIVRASWGQTAGPAAVPEPGVGLLILGIAFVVLAGCRTHAAFAK